MSTWRPTRESQRLLGASQTLLSEYSESITLRQLYYLLVREGLVDYSESAYRKVKNLMINARKYGSVPPTTFSYEIEPTDDTIYADPMRFLNNSVKEYRIPRTLGQNNYVEIWVEREPLKVYLDSVVKVLDVPVYVTGGYSSLSFVFEASQRLKEASKRDGSPRVIYLSDFSPASLNMFESQVTEIGNHLGLTPNQASAIMLKSCVEPEHIVRFDLPIFNELPSTQKTALFESTYSTRLQALGLPPICTVEIESLNPKALSAILSNILGSLFSADKVREVIELEKHNKELMYKFLEGKS